jgi:hypothetical protein
MIMWSRRRIRWSVEQEEDRRIMWSRRRIRWSVEQEEDQVVWKAG